jgi:hypothetical protein
MDPVALLLVIVLFIIAWHMTPEKFTPEQKVIAMGGPMTFQYGIPIARIVKI